MSYREKKPVMVWIHGGAYSVGSGSQFSYNGANLVQAQSDIILVNMNYRLNMYGFMDFSSVPGGEAFESASCNGLLDQAMALRWVHENIAAFGGDPDNVTVFGQPVFPEDYRPERLDLPVHAGRLRNCAEQDECIA